jgi:hypothetical protein
MAIAFTIFFAETSAAQMGYTLCSLEWLVADADTAVRGMVADVSDAPGQKGFIWAVVTIDTREVFKGRKAAYGP